MKVIYHLTKNLKYYFILSCLLVLNNSSYADATYDNLNATVSSTYLTLQAALLQQSNDRTAVTNATNNYNACVSSYNCYLNSYPYMSAWANATQNLANDTTPVNNAQTAYNNAVAALNQLVAYRASVNASVAAKSLPTGAVGAGNLLTQMGAGGLAFAAPAKSDEMLITEYHIVPPANIPLCGSSTCTSAQYLQLYAACANGGTLSGSITPIAYYGTTYYTYSCIIPAKSWYLTSTNPQYAGFVSEAKGQVAWTNPNGPAELITTNAVVNTLPAIQTTFTTNNCDALNWVFNSVTEKYVFFWSTANLTTGIAGETDVGTSSGTTSCNTPVTATANVSAGQTVTLTKTFSGDLGDYSPQTGSDPAGHGAAFESTLVTNNPYYCAATYTVKASDLGKTVYFNCCKNGGSSTPTASESIVTTTGMPIGWGPC